jgi:NADH-quinone oxidoreductase subunit J
VQEEIMSPDMLLFLGLAGIAVAAAVAMLFSRNAVYAALFLVINFLTIAAIYLLLHAAFIAAVQVSVYAGAIMVLFLFVIMLLGAEKVETSTKELWQRPAALALAAILMIELAYAILRPEGAVEKVLTAVPEGFGSPETVGRVLYSRYLLPFEAISILLLVSMVGAIIITRDDRKGKG